LIVAIFAVSVFIGYKRGLIKSAIKILTFFIAIIIALILYRPVTAMILDNTNLGDRIQSGIVNNILPEGTSPDETVQLDESLVDIIGNAYDAAVGTTVNNVAGVLTVQIVELLVLMGIFLIVKIGLRFVSLISDFVTKIPILKQFNEVRRNYLRRNTRYITDIYNTCSDFLTCTSYK